MVFKFIKYQTGTLAITQLITLAVLNIFDGLASITHPCSQNHSSCFGDILLAIAYYVLLLAWFSLISLLGYLTQEKRNRLTATLLIGSELATAVVSLFNWRHGNNEINKITSLVDLTFAILVNFLAIRILLAKGRRIVTARRRRQSKLY